MIRNYITVAFRNLTRYTSYSIINVLGLGLGMACALLIFALVSHHLSYDNFHPELDRAYRLVTEQHRDQVSYTGSVPAALGKALREDYTFTEKVGRQAIFGDQLVTVVGKNGEVKKFMEPDIAMAEADFFDIFSIRLVNGNNPAPLFTDLNTAIISENVAKKYYGNEDPIGQVFKVDQHTEFRVVGVMKNVPDNTDLRAEIYVSYEALKNFDDWLASDSWSGISSSMRCYVRLKPGVNIAEMEETMFGYVAKFRSNSKNIHHYRLLPVAEMHFDARYGGSMSMQTLVALSVIGFFLVITACVNFVNLATARATGRQREVGVRKVMGGLRSQILRQFMAETFVITLLSIVLSAGVVWMVIPIFNEWFNSRLSPDLLGDWQLLTFVPLLLLFVTFVAGFYPGVVLSGFKVAEALKGKLSQSRGSGLNLRRALIVTQFSISQLLIIGLIVIIYQLQYAKTTDLGFDRDAVLMITMGSHDEKAKTLKSEIERIPGVQQVSMCWAAPSAMSHWGTGVRVGNNTEDENFSMSAKIADPNYISLFDIELVAGRNLTESDTLREFLVNEKFAESLGVNPEELIGQIIAVNGDWRFPIVGVVKDFHDASLHENISPIFIGTSLEMFNNYAVKIGMANASSVMKSIEEKWSAVYPALIYEGHFLDEEIANFYRAEENMMKLVQVFSFVAIVVGCMGLFGLVSFMSLQRTKEIGIRKVLGSNVAQILWIFGKEFSMLIVVAFGIASPAGWLLMNSWLMDYEYRVPLSSWIFLASLGATFVIAALTVGYRSMRAATANPVNSLRTE